MKEQQLNQRLSRALAHAAPDDVEAVLSRCETRKGTVIPMTTKKRGALARNLIAACLALVLVGGGGGLYYQQANAVASVVSLDVNPSIELTVNRNEKVLTCTPLNEDAQLVLADMGGGADLKGTKLDVAVNAIVGALLKHGYLDSISSAILISVEDKDPDRADRLQQELTAAVDGVLQANASNAAVLSQTLTLDAGLEQQAKDNNISTGKAALVNQVLELNSQLSYTGLAGLSVEELKDLIKIGAPAMPIGMSAAQTAAERYAGTTAVSSVTADVDPELDEQVPHYEVELHHPTLGKFEYLVDAWTGEVLSGTPNILDGGTQASVTQTQALDFALAHMAGLYPQLDQSGITSLSIKSKTEDGRPVYELEFTCGSYQFEYEIDAYTGSVLDWEAKQGSKTTSAESTSAYITADQAKQAALDHAGVAESQTSSLSVELDEDKGRTIYEVEFKAGGVKYKYEIDALDASIWKYEPSQAQIQTQSAAAGEPNGVTESVAKAAALEHAGYAERDTTYCNVWTEYEDGHPHHYQVEFAVGSRRYVYEISLTDCSVLAHWEHSHQDHKNSSSSSSVSASIGEEAAKAAALDHAGLTESQVSGMKVKLEDEHGTLLYEVEFKVGKTEYEYEISASDGSILSFEIDD